MLNYVCQLICIVKLHATVYSQDNKYYFFPAYLNVNLLAPSFILTVVLFF